MCQCFHSYTWQVGGSDKLAVDYFPVWNRITDTQFVFTILCSLCLIFIKSKALLWILMFKFIVIITSKCCSQFLSIYSSSQLIASVIFQVGMWNILSSGFSIVKIYLYFSVVCDNNENIFGFWTVWLNYLRLATSSVENWDVFFVILHWLVIQRFVNHI